MQIIQTQQEPIALQLVFTANELKNSLFEQAKETMTSQYTTTVQDSTIIVTGINDLQSSIDNIRELWCGDVTQDPNKDLSKCPRFVLGDFDAPVDPNSI
ncbi:MAG: hypothetical protein K8E24_013175 [Methanobacterium paludis]|nr:hypothetical protein [Methanobacterium paludis]